MCSDDSGRPLPRTVRHPPGVRSSPTKEPVIGVHHTTDSRLGSYFAAGLDHAGLTHAAPILSADANDEASFLTVTVALQNLADWKLRSQVHQVAMRVVGRWVRMRGLTSLRDGTPTRILPTLW